MPIYEYECPKCGSFEHTQSIRDTPLARCPKCRRKVQRLISRASFHLKGGGWYADGYASAAAKKADADSPAANGGASDSAAKKESTAAATPAAAPKKAKAKKADSSTVS
jgi:putative FmdB family regulatory protein